MKYPAARVAALSTLIAGASAQAGSIFYANESNNTQEADYAVLQFPPSITVQAGTNTGLIYGQVYEASYAPGATSPPGQNPSILAQLGVGPSGSNPFINDAGWAWSAAVYNLQSGNNDEYMQSLTPLVPGTYAYTYRFSFDGGSIWTLADLDGAGSNPNLVFSANQLGVLTVTAVPAPGFAVVIGAAGLAGVMRRRRCVVR